MRQQHVERGGVGCTLRRAQLSNGNYIHLFENMSVSYSDEVTLQCKSMESATPLPPIQCW